MKKNKAIHIFSFFLTAIFTLFSARNGSFEVTKNDDLILVEDDKVTKEEKKDKSKSGDTLEIKMIDLHNDFGDSTLITYKNDIHILIDAGGTVKSSGDHIYNAIKDLDRIDYLIFTHADSDHIANFISPKGALVKWLDTPNEKTNKLPTIGTLIDFDNDEKQELYVNPKGPADITGKPESLLSNITKYKANKIKYMTSKQIELSLSASEAVKAGNTWFGFNGSTQNGIRILDNYYYDNWCEETGTSKLSPASRNVLSVCCLIKADGKKALFTGDLEEFDSGTLETRDKGGDEEGTKIPNTKPYKRIYGESLLVAQNYKYLKDGVDFFKAGHHGSYTSNSANLLDVIRPKYIGVSCYATHDNTEIKTAFPSQLALYNMMKWTDYIYVNGETLESKSGKRYKTLYGDIIYRYNNATKVETFTSSNIKEDKRSIAKDKYYLENRVLNYNIYSLGENDETFNGGIFEYNNAPSLKKGKKFKDYKTCTSIIKNAYKKSKPVFTKGTNNATYIKFGHIDILVNFGQESSDVGLSYNAIKKINSLCNDNELEYLILTHNCVESYNRLLGSKGLLKNTTIKKIDNFYHYGIHNSTDGYLNKNILEILKDPLIKNSNVKDINTLNDVSINILNGYHGFSLDFDFLKPVLGNDSGVTSNPSVLRKQSLTFMLSLSLDKQTHRYLNLGGIYELDDLNTLLSLNESKLNKIDIFDVPTHLVGQVDDKEGIRKFYRTIHKATVNTNFLFNGTVQLRENSPSFKVFDDCNIISNSIYDSSSNNKIIVDNGDVVTRVKFGKFKSTQKVKQFIYSTHDVNYYSLSVQSTINNALKETRFTSNGNIMNTNR